MKTDLELQLALAKMLLEKIHIHSDCVHFYWKDTLQEIEWDRGGGLHVCWLIEQGLTDIESQKLKEAVYAIHEAKVRFAYSASWQQRATALIICKRREVI